MQYLSCPAAWTGALGAVGQSEITQPTGVACPQSSPFSLRQTMVTWCYHMGTWDGRSRVWHLLWSTGPIQNICWRKPAERVVSGAWQGHVYSVELEGRKKSAILGSSWTPLMSYHVVSHSGAMECLGDLLFPTSNIFKGILFLLCSLWRGGVTPDTLGLTAWLCWILEDSCPDARVTCITSGPQIFFYFFF